MKPIIMLVAVMLLTPLAFAQPIEFTDYFEDATMRIDYFHTANATCDEIAVDQIYVNGVWAGNPKKLLPPMENGRYAIKVVDIASNKLMFSRQYLDSVFEYKGTDAAKEGRKRTYHQSALIPCPKQSFLFTLERRDKHHMLHSVFSQIIDPNDRSVKREPAFAMDKSFAIVENGHPHDCVDLVFVAEGYRSEEIFTHEFGHGFAGLADEFVRESYFDVYYTRGVEPLEPNITANLDPDRVKWRRLLPPGVPLPTPAEEEYADVVGLFEGAGYAQKGMYRSCLHCVMGARPRHAGSSFPDRRLAA